MNRTSTEAVSIQAVSAGSSFGAAAGAACARTTGTCPSIARSRALCCRIFIQPPLFMKHTSGEQVLGVEAEASLRAIGEPVPQGRADRAKGDIRPGNARLLEQLDLQRF